MTNKISNSSRRTVLKNAGVSLASVTALIGSASASTKEYYAEYRSQRHGTFSNGLSKLQVRVEWDSENGVIQDVNVADITGRANAIRHKFEGIATRESSGGAGESYYQLYVEGDYRIENFHNPHYTHWLDMTVRADGSHTANCNWKLEPVDAGER